MKNPGKKLEYINKKTKKPMHSTKLAPVHITMSEIANLNGLQATEENPSGQYVDPKTGLREYSRLSNILRVGDIRDIFIDMAEAEKKGEQLPQDISQMAQTPTQFEEQGVPPIPSDDEPAVEQVEAAGKGEDTKVVLMPEDVIHFFSELQGGPNTEHTFGLPGFGFGNFLKSAVRVVTTVVGTVGGFIVGGPAGAAAGAYLGNAVGRGLTGQPLTGKNNVFKAAIPNAMYGFAAGTGMGAMGMGAPAATAAPIVNGATGQIMAPAAASAAPAAASAAPSFASSMMPSWMPSQVSALAPYALAAGGAYMASKGDEKERRQKYEEYMRERAAQDERKRASMSEHNRGLEMPITLPHSPSYSAYKRGGAVKPLDTKGVPIKGPGDGQSDSIKQHIEKTWIHDASTTANLGNGSSDAGHAEIKKFEAFIRSQLLPKYKHQIIAEIREKPLRRVPCAVAKDEYETPPILVAALGEGSFEKGGEILKKMTREIRLHKTRNRTTLPPPAHPLETYYKKVISKRS